MNTAQIIADLQKELADTKRAASNEIYVLKEENRSLRSRVEFLCNNK